MHVTQEHAETHQPEQQSAETLKPTLCERYKSLPKGKKVLLTVFILWAAQAIPKWTAAILADGEMSAAIIGVFITPRF